MGSIRLFDVAESRWRFGVDEAGRPYVVAADIARALGYRDAEKAARLLDADERGTQIVGTPSGDQRMSVVPAPRARGPRPSRTPRDRPE